jgi:flagellar biosynthesis protein FlhG
MRNQASSLETLVSNNSVKKETSTKFISITSGKGGVGKSTISANLANTLASMGYNTCLFDADIGLANLDVMFSVKAHKNILNVLKGEATFKDIAIKIKDNLTLIPGESGESILKYSDTMLVNKFIDESSDLTDVDIMIIDTGAGIGEHVRMFLQASDEIIVVTIPDPAAIADAYTTIKISSKIHQKINMIFNLVKDNKEAITLFKKIEAIAKANISKDFGLRLIGKLHNDKNITKCVKQRVLFTDEYPNSQSSIDIKNIARSITSNMERKVLTDKQSKGLGEFFRRLISQI